MQNPFNRIKDPVEGWMHVVGCTAINADVLRAPCHITYVIQADGVPAFSGDQVFELWTNQWPSPGDDLPVVFDRQDTQHVKIAFDQIPSHAESARMHADELAQQLNSGATPKVQGGPLAGWPTPSTVTPIIVGNADPERVRDAISRAEQALGIDLNGDGVGGGAPPASASTAKADVDVVSRLERLAKLRDTGVITNDEFDSQKHKILGES
jgi:hypothetical protein